ncbi:hypothetical protein [Candidatus Thiodictyon syntrophicum]|jgi:GTPase SAR1 family protein|nr:hypothetical protein [Candidatus Thiodictyon syntrophicum]
MVTRLTDWPALAGRGLDTPLELPVQRASWDGAGWHGRGGFDPVGAGLDLDLPLGAEDAPAAGFAWQVRQDRFVAMAFAPAHEGSPGLRKHLLICRRPEGVPAALVAAALLAGLAVPDGPDGVDPSSPLPALPESVKLDRDQLADRLESGIADLLRILTDDDLTALYAAILAGDPWVPFCHQRQPLSALAILALLLPLERTLADDLSVVGWLPSRGLDAMKLQGHWRVIVCGAVDKPGQLPRNQGQDPQAWRARQLVAALRRRDPGLIDVGMVARTAFAEAGDRPVPVPNIRIAVWGLAGAGKTTLMMALLGIPRPDSSVRSWSFTAVQEAGDQSFFIGKTFDANRFPYATTPSETPERYECIACRTDDGPCWRIVVEDRAGKEYENLAPAGRQRTDGDSGSALLAKLREDTDGILLLIDPERTDADPYIRQIVTTLYGKGAPNPDRPLAVCISMCDRLLNDFDDVQHARENPQGFVDVLKDKKLKTRYARSLEFIQTNVARVAFFPISAVGVRPRCGILLPTVVYDDDLTPRPLWTGTNTIHVERPFEWILDQITGAQP